LLEENREKGAFYTPKEIVHYMCQESLIEYLHTQLPNENKEHFEILVRSNKVADEFTNHKKAQEINEKLKVIKVCDPAIGSGAFPMGLLKEIFECRRLLYGYLRTNEAFNPATVKKEIIQNNIYGVDREYGAVEIARLRFWLSLVVDELVPQPLPNLDYKIMQGDSLLESFGGVELSNLVDMENVESFHSAKHGQLEIGADFSHKKQTLLVFDKQSKEKLYELINDYYNYDEACNDKYESKQDIKNHINDIVEGKLLAKFALQKHKVEKQIAEKDIQIVANNIQPNDPKGVIQKKEKNITKLNKDIEAKQKEHNGLVDIIDHLHELQTSIDKPYFLWHLWFKDVFDNKGFDIVIGNPPYIQLQKMGVEADALQQVNYKTFTRTGDIYCLFYELGNSLLKPNGNLIYITSNSWLRSNYGKVLRNYFAQYVNPLILIDLSDSNVFQSATVRTSIFQFKKEINQKEFKAIRLTRKSQEYIKELNLYFSKNHITLKSSVESAWVVHEKEKADIINLIKVQGKLLKEWDIQINRGIITGLNEAFVIDEATKKEIIAKDHKSMEIIKPLLRGRDLSKFHYRNENLWLIGTFPTLKLDIKEYPGIESHLLSFGKEKLEQSGTSNARKKTGNDWFETQDQINYWENFEKPKIIYPNMVKDISFTYDEKGFYTNQKCFILTGEKIKYLLGVLNSKLFRYCFEEDFPELQGNAREINKVVFEEIPIKYPNEQQEILVTVLVDYILFLFDTENEPLLKHTPNNRIAANLEEVLNMVVYELYFESHMVKNKLNVIEFLYPLLIDKKPEGKAILDFYMWLQQPGNYVRNRIIAVDIKSPDYLSRINAATH